MERAREAGAQVREGIKVLDFIEQDGVVDRVSERRMRQGRDLNYGPRLPWTLQGGTPSFSERRSGVSVTLN